MAPAAFTSEQAARGERVFGTVCSVCHGRNEFRGPIFSLTWRVEPVGHLFQHISTTMPQDDPGSLADEEYAAIVAYMSTRLIVSAQVVAACTCPGQRTMKGTRKPPS